VERSTSTSGFTDAVIANLGRAPATRYATRTGGGTAAPTARPRWGDAVARAAVDTRLIGVDVYTEAYEDPAVLGPALAELAGPEFRLLLVSSRGTKVYPDAGARPDHVGWWRCRFVAAEEEGDVDDAALLRLLDRIASRAPWMHVQKLRLYGDEEGFTRAQGQ
jgi:isocitrate dehydrogenase